ncbi:hypothetical protein Clacol_009032 [Clathrus columnatus]|uniref:Carboxymuconolactone decarboxylase-like domain-containing protein n=1 Tax=Clathrus columnatus TaxID=1419009 RepID=A0AAV5ANN2_9AGAM|nr:hypothetical protein Clacol_009032 [Clathrus columnatus]
MTSQDNGRTQKDIPNAEAHAELYYAGMQMRRKVMGSSDFMQPMQQLVTEIGWASIWTRPGLELKQRSLINIALLAYQNHPAELAGHIRGAVNNGATEIEIRETLLQTAVYCGAPTGMASFRVGEEIIQKLKQEGKLPN